MSESEEASVRLPSLGGQAVIEGVMIRGPKAMAVCVRKPDGELAYRTERNDTAGRFRGIPILRGVAGMGEQMGQGMRAMIWSAQVAAGKEPEEPREVEVRSTMATSLGAAAGFFMLAPALTTRRLERVVKQPRVAALFEGFLRMGMLVGYLKAIGRIPQAQRLFGYHGAEHRAIQAYEAEDTLDVKSLQKYPNAHIRCGTSFLLTTTLLSSLTYAALGPQPLGRRLLSRLVLTPVIAGLSFEMIRLASTSSGGLWRLLFRPNMALQALTTRDPDESQMEVALEAVRAALAAHEAG